MNSSSIKEKVTESGLKKQMGTNREMNDQDHCHAEAANHQLPIAADF